MTLSTSESGDYGDHCAVQCSGEGQWEVGWSTVGVLIEIGIEYLLGGVFTRLV